MLQVQFAGIIHGSSDSILRVDGFDSQVQNAALSKGTSVLFAAYLACPAGQRLVIEVFYVIFVMILEG